MPIFILCLLLYIILAQDDMSHSLCDLLNSSILCHRSLGGTLLYVSRYHLPVDRPPFLTQISNPMPPFFTVTVYTQWLLFFKILNFCVDRTHLKTLSILEKKLANFHSISKFDSITPPYFEVHAKKRPIFTTPKWLSLSLFFMNNALNGLFSFSGRHISIIFIFECPPPGHRQSKLCIQHMSRIIPMI